MSHHLFLLLLVTGLSYADPPTCTDQLFEYYVALGMPTQTERVDPILISSIKDGIQLEFAFESVANTYHSILSNRGGPTPRPIIDYVSFDRPSCLTSVDVVCGGALLNNIAKNASCSLVDYATKLGKSSGRTFVYNQEAAGDVSLPAGCTGNVIVRLIGDGLTINPLGSSFYTYSVAGLPPRSSTNLSLSQAIEEYRSSLCTATTEKLPIGQYQHVCIGKQLICTESVKSASYSAAADFVPAPAPVPAYACRGSVPGYPSGQPYMVWHVDVNFVNNETAPSDYCITFCESSSSTSPCQPRTCTSAPEGSRRQYVTSYASFDSVAIIEYLGVTTRVSPAYPFSNDVFVREVPCLCGFSIDCSSDGTINTGAVSRSLTIGNIAPDARFFVDSIRILPDQGNVSLSLWPSIDPDNQPNPLTYLWQVYNTTPSALTIDNPRSPNITVYSDFVPGLYRLIGRVSDGEETGYALLEITVDTNEIYVVLPDYFEVQYNLLSVCPPTGQFPSTADAIKLDGSASYDANTEIGLTYTWTQVAGNPITVPFACDPDTVGYFHVEAFWNTDQPIAYFVPQQLGLYTFGLTVCNANNASSCRYQDVTVSVELNFDFPDDTRENYTDFPDSPDYQIPEPGPIPPTEVIGTPQQPSSRSPTISTTPTRSPSRAPTAAFPSSPKPIPSMELFPTLPPPSSAEKIVLFMAFMGVIGILLLLLGFALFEEIEDNGKSKWDRIKVYQPY